MPTQAGSSSLEYACPARRSFAISINLILAGHEHELIQMQSGDTPIHKMGSDARNLGRIEVKVSANTGVIQSIDCKVISVTKAVPENARTKRIINNYEISQAWQS